VEYLVSTGFYTGTYLIQRDSKVNTNIRGKVGRALSEFSLDFHNSNELEKFLNWIHFIK
jgi:hypothetical protein